MPVVATDERGLDLIEVAEVNVVPPCDVQQTQHIPDVRRIFEVLRDGWATAARESVVGAGAAVGAAR